MRPRNAARLFSRAAVLSGRNHEKGPPENYLADYRGFPGRVIRNDPVGKSGYLGSINTVKVTQKNTTLNRSHARESGWLKGQLGSVMALAVLAAFFLGVIGAGAARPEPTNWFTGDIHVHRSCGGAPVDMSTISNAMVTADLSVVSLLADMGNGEVKDPITDLPKVNGSNAPESPPGRIIRWDAEWHWDATYFQFPHQALGGHIVALGLTNATQIWNESTYPIFQWAKNQGGVAGFAHFQYLPDNSFPTTLDCCLPIEYPVEVALGTCDFISQDVAGTNSAMLAYYRLLNCGFRPGFAAGSDYPCAAQIGDLTTFVQVDGPLTYQKWIEGIRDGRTVISRNGRREFLNLTVNATNIPGDEIHFPAGGGAVSVSAIWSANTSYSGTLEIVKNGVVVASKSASVTSSTTSNITANVTFTNSGWLAVRRMDGSNQHKSHTAAVFVIVNNQPVRASLTDAQFYVNWMDQLLSRTQEGGAWANYFTGTNKAVARARYEAARAVYQQIANEAAFTLPPQITTTNLPAGAVNSPYSQTIAAWRGQAPYQWSINSGTLPSGLVLNTSLGSISGTPTAAGANNFSIKLADSSTPANLVTQALSIAVLPSFPSITIWPTSSIPAVLADSDTTATTAGFKFKTLTRGQILGIRFYKGSSNTGTHTGQLWTSNGTLLASLTFSNETATGWQQGLFTTPVTINSNTVYIASYYAPAGRYSKTENYFFGKGATNHPLIALPSTAYLPNGVYRYDTNGFPTNTFRSTHYWVDVLFQPNNAPAFPAQTNLNVPELTLLTVTNSATDSDVPANTLSYQLVSAPTNATINTNGIISWLPSEAQGPGTNAITSVVSDGVASVTNEFEVVVTEVNQAPGFPFAFTNLSVPELSLLVFTNEAQDDDLPAQAVTYQLLSPPTNCIITNGIVTWQPSEEQGPATNVITTVASDGLAATTNDITIFVLEVNSAPVFSGVPTNTTIPDYGSLLIANGAIDNDVPANVLTYSLLDAPTNAVISTNGVITWEPAPERAPSTNLFTTVVSDGAESITNSFVVTVLAPLAAPTIISITLEDTNAIVTWTSAAGQSYVLEYLDDLTGTNWTSVLPGTTATSTNTSTTNETDGAPMRVYRVRSPE